MTGRGVRVGILDAGFEGIRDRLGTSLLFTPPETGGDHGTDCADVVHWVAPEATIVPGMVRTYVGLQIGDAVLLRPVGQRVLFTQVGFCQGVRQLIGQGAAVISSSIGFEARGPIDGRSGISRKVSEVADSVVFVQAAGNEAEFHHRGTFGDSDGNTFHEFSSQRAARSAGRGPQTPRGPPASDSLPLRRLPPETRRSGARPRSGDIHVSRETEGLPVGVRPYGGWIRLMWDEWDPDPNRPRPRTDLDLYVEVAGSPGALASTERQVGRAVGFPIEEVWVPGVEGRVLREARVYVRRREGTRDVPFRIYVHGMVLPPGLQTARGSLSLPADCPEALTVGAWEPGPGRLASYSSRGPTDDGRAKPDVGAPTDTLVDSKRHPFRGASAATPHVAGTAALLRQAHPEWPTARIIRAGPDRPGLGQLWVERLAGGASRTVSTDEAFTRSDRIRFGIRPADTIWVYLAGLGSGGAAELYWPRRPGQARLEAGIDHSIPERGTFSFDGDGAVERIFVVVAREPLADVEGRLGDRTRATVLDDIVGRAPGWDDTLVLAHATEASRMVMHPTQAGGVLWGTLDLRMR